MRSCSGREQRHDDSSYKKLADNTRTIGVARTILVFRLCSYECQSGVRAAIPERRDKISFSDSAQSGRQAASLGLDEVPIALCFPISLLPTLPIFLSPFSRAKLRDIDPPRAQYEGDGRVTPLEARFAGRAMF